MQQNEDSFVWDAAEEEGFLVKSCLIYFKNKGSQSLLDKGFKKALNWLWIMGIPSNIRIFGWRFPLDRLPTRDQLCYKNIIGNMRILNFHYVKEMRRLYYISLAGVLLQGEYGTRLSSV